MPQGDFRPTTRPGLSQLSQDLPPVVVSSEPNRTLTPQTGNAGTVGFPRLQKAVEASVVDSGTCSPSVSSCQRYFSRACRVTSASEEWFALEKSHKIQTGKRTLALPAHET